MEESKEAIIERCVGLDVHLDTVVACVLYGELNKKTFSITKGILQLFIIKVLIVIGCEF